jgi:hypothetical protein
LLEKKKLIMMILPRKNLPLLILGGMRDFKKSLKNWVRHSKGKEELLEAVPGSNPPQIGRVRPSWNRHIKGFAFDALHDILDGEKELNQRRNEKFELFLPWKIDDMQ